MRFPIADLIDEIKCYNYLLNILHPDGLKCPNGHPLPQNQAPHNICRSPIMDYKCRICGRVYNLFTNTVWSTTRHNCAIIVLIIRGFTQGVSTNQLADELNKDYGTLLKLRHKIQQLALENRPDEPLPDIQTEADELFQNAGRVSERRRHAEKR